MPVRIEAEAEPIPGYRLIERLGRGGFGEVWKAEAPGGLMKAIKFVYGDLDHPDEGEVAAEQELKALSRVKSVRHPYILSLERVDIIGGQLLIVMELADRNSWDRFRECRAHGLPGIPREELLRYMEESAEALDLMNNQYHLQHLDIKPQNLFLVHSHIKVADFGLVKDLEGKNARLTGGITPVYAAPETFEGMVSRFSDQYSLAIVYQELLTGQRPFSGTNARQLLLQHVQSAPDLSALPPGDREAIARALSKDPDQRHASCADLVRALKAASPSEPSGASGGAPHPPSATPLPSPVVPVNTPPAEGSAGAISPPRTPQVTSPLGRPGATTPGTISPAPPAGGRGRVDDPKEQTLPGEREGSEEVGSATQVLIRRGPRANQSRATPGAEAEGASAAAEEIPAFEGEGVLLPALIVGLGQAGLSVLQNLSMGLAIRHGSREALPNIRMFYIDTDPASLTGITEASGRGGLMPEEVMLARLHRPSHYLKPRDGGIPVETWLDPQLLYHIQRGQVTTGLRCLGRLAFVDNYGPIFQRLQAEITACSAPESLAQAARTGLGVRSNRPRVYVVTSLAGGTGSGMFIDVAYVARHLLKQIGFANPDLVGVLLLPSLPVRGLGLSNVCAALTELNHFSAPDIFFSARYHAKEAPIIDSAAPFDHSFLIPAPQAPEEEAAQATAALASGLILRELTTPMGRANDALRARLRSRAAGGGPAPQPGEAMRLSSFGMFRLLYPRRTLIEQAAQTLCHRLVDKWVSKEAGPLKELVRTWMTEKWERYELGLDQVVARLHKACETALGQVPEDAFAVALKWLAALTGSFASRNPPGPTTDFSAITQVLKQLEAMVGQPPSEDASKPAPSGVLLDALDQATRTEIASCEQRLAELAVGLIEQPRFRLAGAEEAIRQMNASMEQVIQGQESLCLELESKSKEIYVHIQTVWGHLQNLATVPAAKRKTTPEALVKELVELLGRYPKTRYQALVLRRVITIFRNLLSNCPEYIREVGFCRARLSELLKAFLLPPEFVRWEGNLGPDRRLYPAGCATLEDAVKRHLLAFTGDGLMTLDQQIQDAIRKQLTALVQVCMAPPAALRDLEALMRREARILVESRLSGINAADVFHDQFDDDAAAVQDLAEQFDQAVPPLAVAGTQPPPEMTILMFPAGSGGQILGRLVARQLPQVHVVESTNIDEIVLYREQPNIRAATLPHCGPQAQEVYRQALTRDHFTPHSRTDVGNWQEL